ncbi:GNAT family N-acetyltransferase [Cyclobacterium jeungdonense]|uniref:GNAT family N-acetyltransferase n=1 Tax=Cyclobacterium jeungdonense TaxID=708087 RepID=A0ABT8C3V0_9BACT|nr:GNAT family N-acetyltransferase [Cyclobacterium jeungdonense]MDN3686727.1 GNAT family N-acetyltransferase [Cyclobacterium jeungdonense]
MSTIETLSAGDNTTASQKHEIADFLFQHLDQYGDPKEDIMRCLDYALDQSDEKGGFAVLAREEGKIVGTAVVNRTGMSGYIPENILVYIAVDASQRGKGLGKKLMKTAIDMAKGDIALHVEPDNPARILYEKLGFTSKYLEMRLKK